MLFDAILKEIGEFGPWQIILYVLLGLVGIPTGTLPGHSQASMWLDRKLCKIRDNLLYFSVENLVLWPVNTLWLASVIRKCCLKCYVHAHHA